jgi:hypothetical protein
MFETIRQLGNYTAVTRVGELRNVPAECEDDE